MFLSKFVILLHAVYPCVSYPTGDKSRHLAHYDTEDHTSPLSNGHNESEDSTLRYTWKCNHDDSCGRLSWTWTQKGSSILTNTTKLDLSENKIKNLTAANFQNLLNLTKLNLNWLNRNGEVLFVDRVFSNMTMLRTLELNGIGLMDIPKDIPNNLRELKLVENKITQLNLTSFKHLQNLSLIYLSKTATTGILAQDIIK